MANRFDIALKKPIKEEPESKKEEEKVEETEIKKPDPRQLEYPREIDSNLPMTRRPRRSSRLNLEDFPVYHPSIETTPAGMRRHNNLLQDETPPGMAAREELLGERGTGSRNLSISCPNGFRAIIPLRNLDVRRGSSDVYNGEVQLIITLPEHTADNILDDIEQARRRLGNL